MGGLLVGLGGLFVAVDLVQDKPLWIVGLLEHVKTQIARLLDGASGVFASGRDKLLNMLRLDLHMDT